MENGIERIRSGIELLRPAEKNVAFYQTGMLGRFLTVEDKNPTNTLEEAQDWLISMAQKQQNWWQSAWNCPSPLSSHVW